MTARYIYYAMHNKIHVKCPEILCHSRKGNPKITLKHEMHKVCGKGSILPPRTCSKLCGVIDVENCSHLCNESALQIGVSSIQRELPRHWWGIPPHHIIESLLSNIRHIVVK